ncbi:MAG: hypothetical protein R2752_07990 [Vicinamibacterales bacterium]
MAGMLGGGKASFLVVCAATLALQDAPARDTAAPLPPDRLPFALIKAESTVEMIGAVRVFASGDAVWISRGSSGTVSRLDPEASTLGATVPIGRGPCGGMTLGLGSLWVMACGEPGIVRIDPAKGELLSTTPTPVPGDLASVAFAAGSVWMVTDDQGTLVRFDPDRRVAVAEVYVAPGSGPLTVEAGSLWAASPTSHVVTRIDPFTNLVVETVKVEKGPARIVAGEGAVWTLNREDGSVSRIDPKTNKIAATIPVGPEAAAGELAVGDGSVWVSAATLLARIDATANRVAQVFTEAPGGSIAAAHGRLWLVPSRGTVWKIDPRYVAALREPRPPTGSDAASAPRLRR